MAKSKKKADVKVKIKDMWEKLDELVDTYATAAIADSWSGGGDPADVPVIQADLLKSKYAVDAQIVKIRREYE